MKVLIDKEDGNPPVAVEIGEVALRMVRASHNPSGLPTVDEAKMLAAAVVQRANDQLKGVQQPSDAARCAAIARTHFETGSMFLVKALTAET